MKLVRQLRWPLAVLAVALLALAGWTQGCGRREGRGEPDGLLVFAAASLRDVLFELEAPFEAAAGVDLQFNFAGSNALALQIEASGRGDVFLSADEEWMDFLEDADLVAPGTRRIFLSNRLVMVTSQPASRQEAPWVLESPGLLGQIPFRGLALADPAAVPAGRYARRYLEEMPSSPSRNGDGGHGATVWDVVAPRVVPALDVRGALALVEAEPDLVGIVYRSDAASSDRVRILYEVPAGEGPEIRYAAAVLRGAFDSKQSRRFLDFLAEREAVAVFQAHGFVPVVASGEAGGG